MCHNTVYVVSIRLKSFEEEMQYETRKNLPKDNIASHIYNMWRLHMYSYIISYIHIWKHEQIA